MAIDRSHKEQYDREHGIPSHLPISPDLLQQLEEVVKFNMGMHPVGTHPMHVSTQTVKEILLYINRLHQTLGFAMSMILSGEKMTDTAEKIFYDAFMRKL